MATSFGEVQLLLEKTTASYTMVIVETGVGSRTLWDVKLCGVPCKQNE